MVVVVVVDVSDVRSVDSSAALAVVVVSLAAGDAADCAVVSSADMEMGKRAPAISVSIRKSAAVRRMG
ncbi:MAG: hypothetical protein IKL87_04790 [Oscillospiraceae bacterium]|nr:hypothetical protein [Oscillospiraceae bacterium]